MNSVVVKQAILDLQHRGLLGAAATHNLNDDFFSCPFYWKHGGRKVQNTPSFSIAIDGKNIGAWNCYNPACGECGRDIYSLYAKLRKITAWDAKDALDTVETPLEQFYIMLANIGGDREKRMSEQTARPHTIDIKDSSEALAYINSRNIPEDVWRRAGLRYCPDDRMPARTDKEASSSKFSSVEGRRIILPISHKGIEIGYSSRAIDDNNTPKYWRPIANVNQTLYNPMNITPELSDFIVVVEGEFDTLACLREGLPTMGSFNASLSQRQASILALFKHVYLAYDMDSAGLSGMRRVSKKWGDFFNYSFVFYNAKDPGKLPVGFGTTFFDNVKTELPDKTSDEEFEEAL